ncbi:MAG: hypothetical protein IMW90_04770, partial [Thermogemmatispora sp.]|uniref:hypothetical protein n=1 Tax=Thermogemmatispora sp. TaxID=1968838 RepID=UPI0019EC00E8
MAFMCLLIWHLLGQEWTLIAPVAHAQSWPPALAPAQLTFAQFLQQRQPANNPDSFSFPARVPALPVDSEPTQLATLPSAQPATMKPLAQSLSPALLSGSAGNGSGVLDLQGSDGRLEIQIPAGSLDFSQAQIVNTSASSASVSSPSPRLTPIPVASPTPTPSPTASPVPTPSPTPSPTPPPTGTPTPPFSLNATQLHGLFPAAVSVLGMYQIQVTDSQGRLVSGVRLQQPITLLYHYQPDDLARLDLDPGTLWLTWPDAIAAARAAGQPFSQYQVPLQNDPQTHTLSAQVTALASGTLAISGAAANGAPPTPLLDAVQGNSGQFSYSYPLSVVAGPPGTTPALALVYSSESTNERHNTSAPSGMLGEGWSLSGLGAITADDYPSGSAKAGTWYFLSGAGASDRLVPNPGSTTSFTPQHINGYRIQMMNANTSTPCFQVWDDVGNYYTFGCTSDSLQYVIESDGTRQNYEWDLNRITLANEGPGTAGRYINITYFQDKTSHGVRSAAPRQIVYGDASGVAGTIDFYYRAPFSSEPYVTSYGTNYNCSKAPPADTTLRCDDPLDHPNGLSAPSVMSTFSL